MPGEVQVALKDLRELVMGVHWDPQRPSPGRRPANLDAQCVMFDDQGCVLEVIHPGCLRNANSSVVHAGDSCSGAGEWDEERIFVFLDALPDSVSALAFLVSSASGHVFSEVPGVTCHLSDRITEREWLRVDLTAFGNRKERRIATLRRSPTGWRMSVDAAPYGVYSSDPELSVFGPLIRRAKGGKRNLNGGSP